MPKLLRSSETAGCGATIELDNGEVVYVSIAQTGVLVRRWDINGGLIKSLLSNFFGPKLYNESSVYKNAQTARALNLIYPEQASPLCFKNHVLAVFSNAIWHCSSAAEVCTVLNEAVAMSPDREKAADTRPTVAAGQVSFDNAGNAVIGMDDLLPAIARYTNEARRLLDISQEEAIRRTEHGDGGRFVLEPLVRILKDTRTYPEASYYAKFHTNEDGEFDSIHHGWCFDSFAIVNAREVTLLEGLQFGGTVDGVLSAFFASAILPTVGAFWHGLYERDYEMVESPEELNELIFGDTVKEAVGDTRDILRTPLGLRIQNANGTKKCACLCHSDTEGILDVEVSISADGRAHEAVRTVLREPEDRTFY